MRTQQEIEQANEFYTVIPCGEYTAVLKDAATECLSLRTQLASANEKLERLETSFKVEQAFRNEYGKRIDQLQQSLLNLTTSHESLREALEFVVTQEKKGYLSFCGITSTPKKIGEALCQSSPSTTLATVRKAFELLNDIAKVPGVDLRMVRAAQELISAAKKENLI